MLDLMLVRFLFLCLSSAAIRNAFLLMLVATSTWLCGLMAVNNSILAFYYIFNVLCLVQVGLFFFGLLIVDKPTNCLIPHL